MLLPGARWNGHCRVTWQMLLPWVRCYFNFSSEVLSRTSSPYVRQMVFAYVFVKGWIIDPYVQCFFDCSTEVLVFPPNYIEVINSDLVTTDVTMVKDWGGCLLMFFEPLCKSSRGFTNVFYQENH